MERGDYAVGVGLRVDATAKIIVSVGVSAHLRRKSGKDGVPAINLRIAVIGLGDAHFGGMFHCVTHAFFQIHRDGVLGLDRSQGAKEHHHKAKKHTNFHHNMYFDAMSDSISCARNTTT